jgi:DNA-directed RNA polymerase subunit K/omega
VKKGQADRDEGKGTANREDILSRAESEYEAIVAIAKEARRLNSAPDMFLEKEEKAIPRAVKNFVEGKVEYQIEGESQPPPSKPGKRRRKKK